MAHKLRRAERDFAAATKEFKNSAGFTQTGKLALSLHDLTEKEALVSLCVHVRRATLGCTHEQSHRVDVLEVYTRTHRS